MFLKSSDWLEATWKATALIRKLFTQGIVCSLSTVHLYNVTVRMPTILINIKDLS